MRIPPPLPLDLWIERLLRGPCLAVESPYELVGKQVAACCCRQEEVGDGAVCCWVLVLICGVCVGVVGRKVWRGMDGSGGRQRMKQ